MCINKNIFISFVINIAIIPFFYIHSFDFDTELHSQILRTGESSYQFYIKNHGGNLKDYKSWKKILDKTFQKLIRNSGKKNFPLRYAIIKDNSFNAFAFPGGQFIIHVGALKVLDKQIDFILSGKKCKTCIQSKFQKKRKLTREEYRERYIAAIFAHELSHYYNQHSFKTIKKMFNYKSKKGNISKSIKQIQYEQEDELDADRSAIVLLQKANYNVEWFVEVLKLLNKKHQNRLEKNKNSTKVIPFFDTHPSPHKRLASIKNDEQDIHKWAAEMEIVFSNIQFGRNLEEARIVLSKSLMKYRKNADLLKAYAICWHKIWEKSASLSDLQVRSIINIPAFRDNMVFKGAARGKDRIPGNTKYYYKAKRAYKKALKDSSDLAFISNYSVLLSYSIKRDDEDEAIQLADKIYQLAKKQDIIDIQLENNLGVVYYIVGRQYLQKGKKHFQTIAQTLNENLTAIYAEKQDREIQEYAKSLKKSLQRKQNLDPDYVDENFTPILNLALIECYFENSKNAKKLTSHYFQYYDSSSKWAEFLSKKSGIKIPKRKKRENRLHVKGIKPGNNLKILLKKWGQADAIETIGNMEIWKYKKFQSDVLLTNGKIKEIILESEKSPKVNQKLKIGFSKSSAEKILGKSFQRKGMYYNYYQNGNASVVYQKNKVKQIILYIE